MGNFSMGGVFKQFDVSNFSPRYWWDVKKSEIIKHGGGYTSEFNDEIALIEDFMGHYPENPLVLAKKHVELPKYRKNHVYLNGKNYLVSSHEIEISLPFTIIILFERKTGAAFPLLSFGGNFIFDDVDGRYLSGDIMAYIHPRPYASLEFFLISADEEGNLHIIITDEQVHVEEKLIPPYSTIGKVAFGGFDGVDACFDGNFMSMAIFDRKLNDQEIKKIMSYFDKHYQF